MLNAVLAARILSRRDRVDAAAALLALVCRGQPTTSAEAECRTQARRRGLGSVLRRAEGPADPQRAPRRAYPGLTTPSMIRSRSSKGRNADFIALIVNQRRSSTR